MIKKLSHYSLQVKIVLFFITTSLLLSVTLGYVFHRNIATTVLVSKNSEMRTLAEETTNKIDRFIFERTADIQVIADSKLITMSGIDPTTTEDYIKSVVKAYKTYDGIFALDTSGKVLVTVGDSIDTAAYSSLVPDSSLEKPYISDLISLADSDQHVMFFSAPLYDTNNNHVGSVIAQMNDTSISDIVSNVRFGDKGYAQLISSSQNKVRMTGGDITGESLTYTAELKKYDTQADTWYLVLHLPASEANKIIDDIEIYFLLVVVISLLGLSLLSFIVSRRITAPIRSLQVKLNMLLTDNKKYTNYIKSSDEIKHLTHSFDILFEEMNFMLQKVLEKSGEVAFIEGIKNSMSSLVEQLPRGIITLDNKGEVLSVNAIASEILGIKADLLIGNLLSKTDSLIHQNFKSILQEAVKSDYSINDQIVYLEKANHQLIPVVISTMRQTDLHDTLIGLTVIIELYDEKMKFEKNIEKAKKLSELGELTAGVAHEIRNPLASIKGYAQFVLMQMDKENPFYSEIEIIMSESDRLDRIIERFINFSEPHKPTFSKYSINKLIEDTIHLIGFDFESRNIAVNTDFGEQTTIEIDHEQLKQVLINLIINSVQSMPSGGQLNFSTSLDFKSQRVIIRLSDTGEGISPDNLEKVFTPFFTTRNSGSGLGLSISARIIENHHGEFDIQSRIDRGTVATIRLPIQQKKEIS
ncbi:MULTISPECIES: PAS domain-containing sensor histidine kinase [unclassified Fusibacter]|uniref:sensor histidine kinase n=1 Tax=unclassified Fusibacter TaxID=2624464 RepID=UPI0010129ACF|nr:MULTISPECIES: PAS domain-containing sensor histidine kinase [unclassified Fusibacter]MCK8059175.1 ATP-binding protein [Fusibacter sp. A2]NPE22584.1 PAS domain-containing protein [Fusibacter sp. A1]RXV60685.1 HAMP domain-containing protein [Fusibacter sp. A1]